jgi:maltooligosyltrehalose trehalohydrolase
MGERLHHQIDPEAYLAASVLLLLAPETPLLFMGQEWAASSPFQFFTDHDEPLGQLVTEGRPREFAAFEVFADPAARGRIPDPQDPQTFERSRLNPPERGDGPHARVLTVYREVLDLRHRMREAGARSVDIRAVDSGTVGLRHLVADGDARFITVVRLSGTGEVAVEDVDGGWTMVLATDPAGGGRVFRPGMSAGPEGPASVRTPGAIVFERADGGAS